MAFWIKLNLRVAYHWNQKENRWCTLKLSQNYQMQRIFWIMNIKWVTIIMVILNLKVPLYWCVMSKTLALSATLSDCKWNIIKRSKTSRRVCSFLEMYHMHPHTHMYFRIAMLDGLWWKLCKYVLKRFVYCVFIYMYVFSSGVIRR